MLLEANQGWFGNCAFGTSFINVVQDYGKPAIPSLILIGISSSSSISSTARCGLWPFEKHPSIFFYLSPTLSFLSLPGLEDLFLCPLSSLSWVFPFFSSLPVLGWRSFWLSYRHMPPQNGMIVMGNYTFKLINFLLNYLWYHQSYKHGISLLIKSGNNRTLDRRSQWSTQCMIFQRSWLWY